MSQMTEEQARALQEKLKQMSPEELREFQKKQCIFCHIVAGKVQSKKIYEDDKVLGILDINPANPGHVLILPKEHYTIMPQVPEDEIGHLFVIAKSISNAMLRALEAQGTNIIVANGVAAGQKAQHFMIHLIPRREKDGVNFTLPQKQISDEQLDEIENRLLKSLGKAPQKKKSEDSAFALPKPPVIQEEPKVVEAEFKEQSKPRRKAKKPEKKQESGEKKEQEGVDLDTIARFLNG